MNVVKATTYLKTNKSELGSLEHALNYFFWALFTHQISIILFFCAINQLSYHIL